MKNIEENTGNVIDSFKKLYSCEADIPYDGCIYGDNK
ncbi:hypothetical protein SDC9_133009 [bioreactor metagenome]|uniref:Uncharacterized protein n=2 Tax=root TaxID=1 RepID=A0A645D939_9ZZZZ